MNWGDFMAGVCIGWAACAVVLILVDQLVRTPYKSSRQGFLDNSRKALSQGGQTR